MLKNFAKILLTLAVFGLFASFVACTDEPQPSNHSVFANEKQKKDSLENLNKYLVSKEKEAIQEYIGRKQLNFVETGTGLCYHIIKHGDEEPVKTGNIVVLDYQVRLLDDTVIYYPDENGYKIFVVGHGGVESGLEEAVLHLHRGDEAEIIIPSHLAYGLLGDGDKIPPRTPIVYYVKIIDNQTNRQ